MSEAVFLIDLASARPPHPPSTRLWPAIAREHCNQLKQCMRRIVTHTETKSVTTHVFDSTVLAQSGTSTTKPPEEAFEPLDRLLEQVTKLDISGVKHPAARGIVAGFSDGAPEDSFSDFYADSLPHRDIYVFARVPSTELALAAFLGDEEVDINVLEQKLKCSPYLPNKLRRLAKRGDRVVWVNSTPRRCERKDDVDHGAEQVFSNWLLSYSPKFQFLSMHSFLLDRRVVPAKAMLRSLSDDVSSSRLSSGKEVDILCLEDSHLLRCFQGRINRFQVPVCESENSKLSLVFSGIVRSYDTSELSALGAFDTPACLLTPSSTPSIEDTRRPYPASLFAGLMVDLARQSRCLIADVMEIDEEKDSFVRYQTIVEPVTPVTAVVWRISRITSAVNYSAPSLPESFVEWMAWDALGKIKDCEVTDSAIQASPKFFETYLPTLFSSQGKETKGDQKAADAANVQKELVSTRTERMLMSFEGSAFLRVDTEQQALASLLEAIPVNPLASEDKALGNNATQRDLMIERLRSQLEAEQKKSLQTSPKSSSPNQRLSQQRSRKHGNPKATQTFQWRSGSSKTMAPRPQELQRCMEAHIHHEKREQAPGYTCSNMLKPDKDEAPGAANLERSHLATDRTRLSVVQNSKEVTQAHHVPSQEEIPPYVLQSTEHVKSRHGSFVAERASDAPSKTPVPPDLGTPHDQVSPCAERKRKAEVLAPGEDQASKRHQPGNLKSTSKDDDQVTECEKHHRRDIRQSVAHFSVLMNKLREGNSRTFEEVLWKCIDHLSTLAAALSKDHGKRCDIDRIINLNLKIPKAVTAAVQEVQNKAKRDDIPSKTVLVETWETIIYAFEQCVWHLASSRRTAINEKGKTGFRRQVRQVSTILTCTQFMAEMAANSRPQPVSFRSMLSKLFSSVFVHLGLTKPKKPFSEVLNLFEKFEEPLPASLRVKNSLATAEKEGIGGEQQEHAESTEVLARASHDPRSRGMVEGEDTSKETGESEKSISSSAAKETKSTKSGSATKVLHSGNRTFGLGRPQFAKESEALRNAMMFQTRLPIKSSKKSLNESSRVGERKRSTHIDELGSSLQAILANTVPAPVIDDPVHAFNNTPEKVHPQARSPTNPNKTQHDEWAAQCVIADDTTVDTSDSEGDVTGMQHVTPKQTTGEKSIRQYNRDSASFPAKHADVGDNGDPEKDRRRPTTHLGDQGNHDPADAFPDSVEKQDSKPRAIHESPDTRPHQTMSPSVSGAPVEMSNLQTMAVVLSESRHDAVGDFPAVDPAHASSVEIVIDENTRRQQKETAEEKQQGVKRSLETSCCVTRSNAKQNMVRTIETDTLPEPSHAAQRRVTRSQAKQIAHKRRLVTSERPNDGPRSSSARKRRRTKELSTDPKVLSDAQNVSECEPPSKSSSPVTRSQAKAMEAKGSIQLRNRSISCPTRRSAVKPEVRKLSADSGSPVKNCLAPASPGLAASSFEHHVLIPETPCSVTQKDAATPQTPRAYSFQNGESSAIRQIAESSLERRKKQLENVDFIPETPVAPIPSKARYLHRDSVKRKLFEGPKLRK